MIDKNLSFSSLDRLSTQNILKEELEIQQMNRKTEEKWQLQWV